MSVTSAMHTLEGPCFQPSRYTIDTWSVQQTVQPYDMAVCASHVTVSSHKQEPSKKGDLHVIQSRQYSHDCIEQRCAAMASSSFASQLPNLIGLIGSVP